MSHLPAEQNRKWEAILVGRRQSFGGEWSDTYEVRADTDIDESLASGLTESDARLIAAAPDLLAALQAALPHIHVPSLSTAGTMRALSDQVRAAITKATQP